MDEYTIFRIMSILNIIYIRESIFKAKFSLYGLRFQGKHVWIVNDLMYLEGLQTL